MNRFDKALQYYFNLINLIQDQFCYLVTGYISNKHQYFLYNKVQSVLVRNMLV